MLNDIIEEWMDLDMEPKPDSSQWTTSTNKFEDEKTLKWDAKGEGICFSLRCSIFWVIVVGSSGKLVDLQCEERISEEEMR